MHRNIFDELQGVWKYSRILSGVSSMTVIYLINQNKNYRENGGIRW